MDKKDVILCPCVDYRGLDDIMVKNGNSLPLISSAFELFLVSSVFTILDLRIAYHLVCIREGDKFSFHSLLPRFQEGHT